MPKERTINPAQAAHKSLKSAALKKSKLVQRTRQNEKLARRNPERLQRQIDDLKALQTSGGNGGNGGNGQGLRPKDQETLERLERELRGVKRAREALGDDAPVFSNRAGARRHGDSEGGENGSLGKRRRDERDAHRRDAGYRHEEESETDEEVRGIPMPRDTPPPIPRRRQQQHRRQGQRGAGEEDVDVEQTRQRQSQQPAVPSKTVYSSAPVLRNLAQESRRFVPAAVAQNIARKKGQGGRLLEPEELDKLESAGYGDAAGAAEEATKEAQFNMMNAKAETEARDGGFDIDAEARLFERELKGVEMEEVEDQDL